MFKFLVDENLLGLARLLRMMGVDAATQKGASDKELLLLAQREQRMLLTQDRHFFQSIPTEKSHLVLADSPRKQLIEVLSLFPLDKNTALNRCLECNDLLQETPKSLLRGKIDEKTYQFYNVFYECSSCHRIYWEGSHYQNLQKEIKKLQDILSSQNPGHNGD